MSSSAISSTSSHSRSYRSPQPDSNAPSPRPSSATSTLDVLIGHLLASKRSLNSVAHLHRASNIIAEARSTLETTAIISARASFLQRSLKAQLHTLQSVHDQLNARLRQSQVDFAALIRDLDRANAELEAVLDRLRKTEVEHAFQPDDENEKTLLDFVDEKPVGEIRDDLRAAIDSLNAIMKGLEEGAQDLEDEIHSIQDGLSQGEPQAKEDLLKSPDAPNVSLTMLLHSMEDHAKEMAISLESLVNHFDLCVTAIKHTEGGGAAAQRIAGDLPEGLAVGDRDFEGPTQSITEDERTEMLMVLHNDASEVDDVVIEIQDRIAEMELQLDQIVRWKHEATARLSTAQQAFRRFEYVAVKLPSYVSRAQNFQTTWFEERAKIDDGMSGLEDLRDVYDNFLTAYDGLIVEVVRRKAVKSNMDKVIQDAHAQLERLFEDDLAQREAFRQDQGDYLPSDIWPGLADPPPRYSFVRTDDSGGSIPALPRRVIEDAYRRLKGS